jgi:hypothetical protein
MHKVFAQPNFFLAISSQLFSQLWRLSQVCVATANSGTQFFAAVPTLELNSILILAA